MELPLVINNASAFANHVVKDRYKELQLKQMGDVKIATVIHQAHHGEAAHYLMDVSCTLCRRIGSQEIQSKRLP